MWPFRTNPRRRAVEQLRAAQTAGVACVLCGTTFPRPTRVAYADCIAGYACTAPCRRTKELTR